MLVTKTLSGYLAPADDEAWELIKKLPNGVPLQTMIRLLRNPLFLRKFFALVNVGYNRWHPKAMYHGDFPVMRNKDHFRKDLIVQAGFFDRAFNVDGTSFSLIAKSIAFDKMTEQEFGNLYQCVLDVMLRSESIVGNRDEIVDEILSFT